MNNIAHVLFATIQNGASEASGKNLWFLLIAYLLLWGLLFGYLMFLHKKLTALESKLDESNDNGNPSSSNPTKPDSE